jgi:hypothetical protein
LEVFNHAVGGQDLDVFPTGPELRLVSDADPSLKFLPKLRVMTGNKMLLPSMKNVPPA